MIEFYKIGKKWYEDHDKNSGLFEANILEKELFNIHCDKKVLIILNGKFFNIEEEIFLLSYMQGFDIKIFIASDIASNIGEITTKPPKESTISMHLLIFFS